MSTAALIVAAGRGVRFGGDTPKQFAPLGGKPLLFHSIEIFEHMAEFDQIRLVLPSDFAVGFESRFDLSPYKKIVGWVAGRARRQDSVWTGLSNLPDNVNLVAIHDAVRPCPQQSDIREALKRANHMGAAILAAPLVDTVKRCDADGRVIKTIAREQLWLAQTPQIFRLDLIRHAYAKVFEDDVEVTDDAAAVERLGKPVEVVQSSWPNPKITTQDDLAFAEWLLRKEECL
jgi:2-C-methyl-D-erythritol 4-phosphate cytidylyltransferase